ncbi:hypothetical protein U8607_05610 [Methylobacterium durans]|uniref:hypothetical protein n=1 Tax=Methylobacterium durans TaxID=2202825 RepID=UPI002AFF2D26|nr:hypothetical protein [Methylobacterium durans]MEA1831556.1 hypothetical protein [Methylobacterium durans]
MVRLDDEGVVLTLRFLPPYRSEDERDYLDALTKIGRRGEPFALLALFGGGGRLSQAGERAQALWFKATRDQFERHCVAIALARPGATERMAETFRRLWPMPLTVTEDEAEARRFLAEHVPALRAGPERRGGARETP